LEPEAYGLAQDRERDALKRIRDEEEAAEGREQVILASRALKREKEALHQKKEELELMEADIAKKATILLAAKNAEGLPVSEDLKALGTAAKQRQSPQLQHGE
jgi:hypothetical protein